MLSVVAEKTGYPTEMLDLDLDLEGDLGIDTVKQAELFATIREHYSIPRREDLRLSDYNTLAKVIQFMQEATAPAESQTVVEANAEAEHEAEAVQAEQPAPVQAASPAAPADRMEEVKSYVLSAVAEKTGYPVEMLDLDLDLEGDLGIDTVKQAELFATIRTHYDIPRREDLRLSDYNTLAKVIQFMLDATSPAEQPEAVEEAAPAAEAPLAEEAAAKTTVEAVVEETIGEEEDVTPVRRRVPVAVLRPRLDLCKPTGVELAEGSRVVVVTDDGKAADSLARKLRSRKVQVLALNSRSGTDASEKIFQWLDEGSVQGVYYLPGLNAQASIAEMSVEDWQAHMEELLYRLYAVVRSLPKLDFLVCATQFDGLHGRLSSGLLNPLGGAVSGFAKAFAMEQPDCLVKVVDFAQGVSVSKIASRLIQETLKDRTVVEIGWEGDQRFTLILQEQELDEAEGELCLGPETVFVVSGGAGGITSQVVTDLARRTGGHFYLFGRTPMPKRTTLTCAKWSLTGRRTKPNT